MIDWSIKMPIGWNKFVQRVHFEVALRLLRLLRALSSIQFLHLSPGLRLKWSSETKRVEENARKQRAQPAFESSRNSLRKLTSEILQHRPNTKSRDGYRSNDYNWQGDWHGHDRCDDRHASVRALWSVLPSGKKKWKAPVNRIWSSIRTANFGHFEPVAVSTTTVSRWTSRFSFEALETRTLDFWFKKIWLVNIREREVERFNFSARDYLKKPCWIVSCGAIARPCKMYLRKVPSNVIKVDKVNIVYIYTWLKI